MARILATNQDLCRRLENLESHSVFHRGANSITTAIPELDDLETIRPTEDYQSVKECYGLNASQLRFAFEGILEASRVYKKYQQNECDKSFRNSVALSRAWSYLSDLSLAQISSVSVIALPICANDLSNPQWYVPGSSSGSDANANKEVQPEHRRELSPHRYEDVPYPYCRTCGKELKGGDVHRLSKAIHSSSNSQGSERSTNVISAAGGKFHPACFGCDVCRSRFPSGSALDYALSNSQFRLCASGQMAACICTQVVLADEVVHNTQIYCAGCFQCKNCKRLIQASKKAPPLEYTVTLHGVFCMQCVLTRDGPR